MDPREVKTAEEALSLVDGRGLSHAKVGVFDMDGILRGKYMARDKLASSLNGGFGFCDVVLGWDSADVLYENPGVQVTGWHTGYPDAAVRLLPDTLRDIPFEGDMLLMLGEFAGEHEGVCPRGVLRRVIARAEGMGYLPVAGAEYEFFLFDETPHSIRDKGYRDLRPITPGMFGYSMLRASPFAEFHMGLLELCELMDMPLEGLHTETGPGVMEAAIRPTDALAAADRAALFKTFAKIHAQRHEMLATFMAKWSMDYPGQSGHIHVSLKRQDGGSVFHAPDAEYRMSDEMRWFLGGQQALLPELLSMAAPTVNAFTRLVPGFWAPTAASWGVENRTTALRVIPGSAKSQRVEYRVAGADGNPYIVMAAALGSGLWGIENKIEPTEVSVGNAYEKRYPRRLQFPETLSEAARALDRSKVARELFGDAFVEHFAATRVHEDREARRTVSDWELSRYFEII